MKKIVCVFVLGLALVVPVIVGHKADIHQRVHSLERLLASIQGRIDLVPKNTERLEKALEDEIRLRSSEMESANKRITELEKSNIMLNAALADLTLKFNLVQKGNEELVKQLAPPTQLGGPMPFAPSGVALPPEILQQMSALGGMNGMALTPELLQQISAMGGANGVALPPELLQQISAMGGMNGMTPPPELRPQGQVNPMGGANSFVLTREMIKQTCPQTVGEGWTCSWSDYFGCYCILADDVGKTLQEAKSLCEGFGVQLVAIETPEEQEHLANQLFKILKGKGKGYFDEWFWTSGYYPGDKLVWASTNQNIEFTTWIGGKKAPKGDNRFVYMDSREPFNWGYTEDGYRLNTICEGPPLPPLELEVLPCPNDIGSSFTCKHFDGFGCYCASLIKKDQEQAKEQCRQHGMKLVSIETEDKNTVIRAFLKHIGKTDTFLTSGSNTKRDGNWIWSTTGQKVNYTSWGEGHPKNDQQALFLKWDYPFLWTTSYDWSSEFFICEL